MLPRAAGRQLSALVSPRTRHAAARRLRTLKRVVPPPPSDARNPGPLHPGGFTEAQIRFGRALGEAMRREWVIDVIAVSNIAVYALMVLAGVSAFSPSARELLGWGANYAPLTRDGEWWRLFTSVFVHGGLVHLGFNTYALLVAGRLVERVFGHAGIALVYLFAGLTGSASSTLTGSVPSVGASGAIFGIFGALLSFLLIRRALVPMSLLRRLRSAVLTFVAVNVAFGVLVPGIDNAAHLGGLAGGFVAGLLLAPTLKGTSIERPWARYPVVVVVGGAIVWAVAFTRVLA